MVLMGENSAYEYSGEKQINEKKMSDAYFQYYAQLWNYSKTIWKKIQYRL